MATITYDDGHVITVPATVTTAKTGHGRSGAPMLGSGAGRLQKVVTGAFSFDSSYPTGGEDISDIFNQFPGGLQCLYFDPSVPLTSAGTGKRLQVDYTNKKLLLYDNAVASAQVANASDQSGSAGVRFIAVGIA